ncbi:hypothetical protein B0H11DRAFT_1709353 [Mycena galericulata]|nr:hypothetical protein B0H11DRAFT_1709353 [Mycena galericulata]
MTSPRTTPQLLPAHEELIHFPGPPLQCVRSLCALESRSWSALPRHCRKSSKRNQKSVPQTIHHSLPHVLCYPATHLTSFIFDGAHAYLISMNPLYQATHSFALGSQSAPLSYNFGAIFGSTKVFML